MAIGDLVSIAKLQAWFPDAANNTTLANMLITQVSRAIVNELNRDAILPITRTDYLDGRGASVIMLPNWPVTNISALVIDGLLIPAAPPMAVGILTQLGWLLESFGHPDAGMQRLFLQGYAFNRGTANVAITYTFGYQTVGEAGTIAANAYTVKAPNGDWATDQVVTFGDGTPLVAVPSAPGAGQYTVAAGVYTFNAADNGKAILVSYGYVPSDLALAAMLWVSEIIAYGNRIAQASKSLGGQETVSYIVKDVPPMVANLLSNFKRVVAP
jgi:hypothetical protein